MASKKELEIFLSKMQEKESKKFSLQQYSTPSNIAADLLWIAFMNKDIKSKAIADLGSGNGILAIGAKKLGAKKVYAVEKDKKMIQIAEKNAGELEIEFLEKDIKDFHKKVDTVVMNPPFGKKPKHLDRYFLLKGFEISKKIYSIHTANSYDFLDQFASKKGFFCEKIKEFDFPLKKTFHWHRKPIKEFEAVMILFAHKSLKKEN